MTAGWRFTAPPSSHDVWPREDTDRRRQRDFFVSAWHYLGLMRWFARPEGDALQLRHTPRPASWNKADHPDQERLQAYLNDTEDLLGDSRVDGQWALRLDVGARATRDLLREVADLDNYVHPLADRIRDSSLVSVWCTKQHDGQSFVQIEAAREVPSPSEVLVVRTTASSESSKYKDQIKAAVAGGGMLPDGPVRLELSFVIGNRGWLGLWKPTIDALDPILGRTYPDNPYHPLDGRITELGMHLTVDRALGYDVLIGITAAPAV